MNTQKKCLRLVSIRFFIYASIVLLAKPIGAIPPEKLDHLHLGIFEYPPYMTNGKDGNYGYCHALVKKIFHAEGVRVIPHYSTIAALTKQAAVGRIDGVCALPQSHSSVFHYSIAPIVVFKWKLWMRKNFRFEYKGPKSYKGLRIARVSSWTYKEGLPEFQKVLEKSPKTFVVSGKYAVRRAFKLIDSNRADVIGLDESHASYILENHDFKNKFKSVSTESGEQKARLAITKSFIHSATAMEIFEKGYAKLKKNGEIKRLKKRFKILPKN